MARANFHFGSQILVPDSDWISGLWYDPDNAVLEVDTKTQERYRYYDVGTWTFAKLVTAKSVGKAFNETIKSKYRRRKLAKKS